MTVNLVLFEKLAQATSIEQLWKELIPTLVQLLEYTTVSLMRFPDFFPWESN